MGSHPLINPGSTVQRIGATSLENALSSEAGRAASERLEKDEARFIDFARSRIFIAEEHEIF